MKTLTLSLLAAGTLFLAACTNDMEEQLALATADRTPHSATLRLEGGIDRFDEAATRSTTADWDDGAVIYVQYQTSSGRVDGTAVYNQSRDEWTVNYYGTITKGQQAKCEVYYFENPGTTSLVSVALNAQSAVYSDNQATYLYEDGTVTLRARLKPLTGRVRFRGTAGYQFSFSGLKWYSSYNITANTLSQQSGYMTLTVGADGYTPYVYAAFADDTKRQLSVDSGDDDYAFTKSFETGVLTTGKSGYINIPTMTSRNGWQLVDGSKLDFTVTGNGNTVKFTMIKVKPGTFQMGSNDGKSDEKPVHTVILTKAYYMGETEVTQALWYAVMGQKPTSDGSAWSSSDGIGNDYPAYYISYTDCQSFISKLNTLTGQKFRMPTEAEWEFAARGGTKSKGYTYAGSNTLGDVAWYYENSSLSNHPVGQKKANELGLYDMSGNVWEWCGDWYGSYTSGAQTDPTGPTTASFRVLRGGSWYYNTTYCRVAYRFSDSPGSRTSFMGLRLAL